jgi:hypothetical protein
MKGTPSTPLTRAQDDPGASCLLSEQGARLSALGQHIAFLMHLQAAVQRICGLSFGYNVTLGALLQFAGERLEQGLALAPSMQDGEAVALVQLLGQTEVKAVLDELPWRFAADTSLEDVIQSLVVEYTSLQIPPPDRARRGRQQA